MTSLHLCRGGSSRRKRPTSARLWESWMKRKILNRQESPKQEPTEPKRLAQAGSSGPIVGTERTSARRDQRPEHERIRLRLAARQAPVLGVREHLRETACARWPRA